MSWRGRRYDYGEGREEDEDEDSDGSDERREVTRCVMQKRRAEKAGSERHFLLAVEEKSAETETNKKEVEFAVSGSTGNVYTLKLSLNCQGGGRGRNVDGRNGGGDAVKLECNCPDFSSGARQVSVLCKHCCFIVLKVLKLTSRKDCLCDPSRTLLVGSEIVWARVRNLFLKPIEESCADVFNQDYAERFVTKKRKGGCGEEDKREKRRIVGTAEEWKEETKDRQSDDCGICFEPLFLEAAQSAESLVRCTTCKNFAHKQCIDRWVARSKSCIYCRATLDYSKSSSSSTAVSSAYVNVSS